MSETQNSPLDNLHIASPCHASWDGMTGDDQARFCKSCNKNVFNLTMMTRQDAEKLIRVKEGNLCVRYSQREDGTIITQDCPVGLERAKQTALRPWRAFATGITAIVAAVSSLLGIAPRIAAQPPLDTSARVHTLQGDMAMPTQKSATKPAVTMMGGPRVVSSPPAVKMGEAAPKCVAPTQSQPAQIMGKPSVATMQGGMQPPVPAHSVKMGEAVAPRTLMGSPPVVPRRTMGKPAPKSVAKKAVKKVAPKNKRAAR